MSNSIVNVNVSLTNAPTPATLQQTGALISQGGTNTSPNTSSLLTQLSDLTPLLNGAKAITSMVLSSGTVTVTATSAHGFTIGDTLLLTITGVTPAAYNGTFLVTVTTTTAFTYALGGSPGAVSIQGMYTNEDVAELLSMATTFFAQGSSQSVYVLELGPGNANDGVAALSAYITANPNANYTPGASGYFYSYLVPREWDGNANFLTMIASFENSTARTYFFVTTTLQTYAAYTNLMKCVVPLIESPLISVFPANVLTAITWSGGLVTATTTSAHGVAVGSYFSIAGVTPAGYNGIFLAQPGTSATTLIYSLVSNPGVETVLGTLVASYYANPGINATEFSLASAFWVSLHYAPSTTNRVTPFAFSFVFGVTPFPSRGNQALLATLKAASMNWIGTGAEGGISNTILLWGTTCDANDFTYWYSVDWVQINLDLATANAVINGSNNPINPLYYNQPGIDRLQAVAAATMARGVTYGLVLGTITQTALDGTTLATNLANGLYTNQTIVNAVPFVTYSVANPSDYRIGKYAGFAVIYAPQRGFINIVYNVNVTSFVTN